jgi:hypothetical protein
VAVLLIVVTIMVERVVQAVAVVAFTAVAQPVEREQRHLSKATMVVIKLHQQLLVRLVAVVLVQRA